MIKSVRWKLMAWYAVIVAAITAAFGTLTHVTVQRLLVRELDDRLSEHAWALADVLIPEDDGTFLLELLPEQVALFHDDRDDAFYYRIWNSRRSLVDTSHPELPLEYPSRPGSRTHATAREVIREGPAGSRILVGRGMREQQSQLNTLAGTSVGVGLIVMLPLLAGGWFLTRRALAPIERISRAAAAVSASQRDERIDVSRMETELAELAMTVNAAFDRLRDALDRQTRFTADASHELRTPLSVILARADLALKSERTRDEYREALTVVRQAATRMSRVIEDLLLLARTDAGDVPLVPVACDLREAIQETCRLLQPLIDQQNVKVTYDLEPVTIMGDRHRISEALANIVSNAVQYNRQGGDIHIHLGTENDQAVITVTDTGPGIPQDQQPYVFDRFFRVDESRTVGAGAGSGLGLAITKWIAEAHGGSVALTSREGDGTTVVMRLGSII